MDKFWSRKVPVTERSCAAETRSVYGDVVKGIAILLVLLGHSIQYGSGADFLEKGIFFDDILFKAIYSFHMPLFALISGYFFYVSSKKYSGALVFKRQVRGLVVPAIAWTVSFRCLGGVMRIIAERTSPFDIEWFKVTLTACFGGHWFLWAMFLCSLVVIVVKQICRDESWVYLLAGIAMMFLPNQVIHNYSLYVYLYPYFVFGYFANRTQLFKRLPETSTRTLIAAWCGLLVVYVLMLGCFSRESYIYVSGISLCVAEPLVQLKTDLFRWAIGLVGSCVVLLLIFLLGRTVNAKRHLTERVTSVLSALGKRTIGIYLASSYINLHLLVPLTSAFSLHYYMTFIETVIVLGCSLAVISVLERIPFARSVFLGQKRRISP